MASWSDPVADLRNFLADTADFNLVKNRPVFGATAGQNRTFITFDDRLLASGYQNICGTPLRVFFDTGSGPDELTASGIRVTDQLRGEFQTMLVPSGSVKVTATYHFQHHLTSELNFYLQQAALQVNADVPANVPAGLQLAALHIAGTLAYTVLAQRWQQRKSAQFLLGDEPVRNEIDERVAIYRAEADRLRQVGYQIRESYYNLRQDKGKAPAYGLLNRIPPPWTPRR